MQIVEKQPQFSVIITTLCHTWELLRALKCVEQQTFKDYECILVSEGRLDDINKRKILSDYNIPNFYTYECETVFGVDNIGIEARNYGISKARGKYIAYLEAGDVWYSDYLLSVYSIIDVENHTSLVITVGEVRNKSNCSIPVGLIGNRGKVDSSLVPSQIVHINTGERWRLCMSPTFDICMRVGKEGIVKQNPKIQMKFYQSV